MSSTPSYHLPQINTKAAAITPITKDHASLPTTPKSSSSAVKFHYDPYNNFSRVYMNSTSTSPSATSTPRSIAAAGGCKQGQGQEQYSYKNTSSSSHDNSSYDDENDHAHDTSSLSGDEDQHHVSGTCTPAVRMETEQQFNEAECNNNNDEMMMTVPKPRSSNIQDADADADDLLDHRQPSTTLRATTRTMQHLLQNVPYLFLDTVAESTVMCRDTRHRVGQLIRTWSGPKTPLELEQEFPERYQGQCIRDIFVAQLPFDLPLDAVQLVADLLIEGPRIHVLHAAPHIKAHKSYDGCSFVKMFECDAVRFINAMHKRVLFDVDGVWVATTTPELQELTDYCAWFQEQKHDQRKEILKMPTPFSAMTAEFALRGSRRATGNFYDNRQPHQQQQQQQNNNNNNNTTYYHAAPPSADQHYYYNAVYDQNPHQRQVSSTNNNYINHYRHNHHNNNGNNNGGYIQQQQQQQQHYHHQHQQQQGTYQQGCSFYPNQAQNQYLAPHQQRALQNSNYHNNGY